MKYQPFYVCLDESVFISLFYLFVGSIFARGENKLNQIDNLHNGFLLFFLFFFFLCAWATVHVLNSLIMNTVKYRNLQHLMVRIINTLGFIHDQSECNLNIDLNNEFHLNTQVFLLAI